jgi:hypothetical protein
LDSNFAAIDSDIFRQCQFVKAFIGEKRLPNVAWGQCFAFENIQRFRLCFQCQFVDIRHQNPRHIFQKQGLSYAIFADEAIDPFILIQVDIEGKTGERIVRVELVDHLKPPPSYLQRRNEDSTLPASSASRAMPSSRFDLVVHLKSIQGNTKTWVLAVPVKRV